MRILHINCNYIGTTLHQLMVENLDELGIENEVFVPTYDRSIAVIKPNDNVYVSECFNKWDRIAFDYKQKKILNAIEKQYDVRSFDLIHAYTLFTDGNVAKCLSEKYNVPYVVAVRNTDIYDFFKKMIHLRSRGVKIMLSAKKIFFLSQPYLNTIIKKYVKGKFQDEIKLKSKLIPNGIDEFWFENIAKSKRRRLNENVKLIYAGVIDKNKNITTTQAAMDILKLKGYKVSLTVVGRVVDHLELERVKKNIDTKILGAVGKKELIDIYRANDIFVMPSIHETFGLVYAEAMSQGLPVVYTKGQGFDEQFKNGVVGFAVDCMSASEIANAIIDLLSEYEKYSKNAIYCCQKFDWKKIATEYANIYEEIIR